MKTFLFELGDTDMGVVGLNIEVTATHLDAAIEQIQAMGYMSFEIPGPTPGLDRATVHINGENIDESDLIE